MNYMFLCNFILSGLIWLAVHVDSCGRQIPYQWSKQCDCSKREKWIVFDAFIKCFKLNSWQYRNSFTKLMCSNWIYSSSFSTFLLISVLFWPVELLRSEMKIKYNVVFWILLMKKRIIWKSSFNFTKPGTPHYHGKHKFEPASSTTQAKLNRFKPRLWSMSIIFLSNSIFRQAF